MKKPTNAMKETSSTVNWGPPRQPRYSAEEKAQAVLAVWTERARPGDICRQLSITWGRFTKWQQRAMEGMLQALESRVDLTNGETLNPRLRALLHKQHKATSRLRTRLEKIQSDKVQA